MSFSYLITLILVLSLSINGSLRFKNKAQLLPLLIRSKPKFIYHLFMKHFTRDIYIILVVPIIILLTDNTINLKISLLVLCGITQGLVRTYDYFEVKNSIWLLNAPLIISTFLFDETLTLILSLTSSIILIFSIINVMKTPISFAKSGKPLILNSLTLFVLTLLPCLLLHLSPFSAKINISQIIPLVVLMIILKLESTVTSKKEVIQRFQSYMSIYRLRISKLTLDLLGHQIRHTLNNSGVIISTLVLFFCITTKRIDTAAVLILLSIYGILANIDLLIYYYILDKSIVYENNVTRFIVSQIPTTLLFSYITITSIDMYLPITYNAFSLIIINIVLIITLLFPIIFYLKRIRDILKIVNH